MTYPSFSEFLLRALRESWSTAHFNISTLEQMRAICIAAAEVRSPVVIGTSEGERKHIGLFQAVALRDAFRKEFGIPIFLNADHSKSVEAARAAVDAGYDSVHIDLSTLLYEDNIAGTKEAGEYARRKSQAAGYEINVEGELGILKTEQSKIYEGAIEVGPEDLTDPEMAAEFVSRTAVDRLAPAVGTFHGIATNQKVIYPELIQKIRKIIPQNVGVTLHGGSGVGDEDIQQAVRAGINNIHINTEIRIAYVEALRKALAEHPEETTPYKLLPGSIAAVKALVMEKLELFGSINRL